MREFLIRTIVLLVTTVLTLGLFEIALRASPSLIGLAILERFPPSLGREIAEDLGLSTQSNRRLISSQDRSDRGPPFYTYMPDQTYTNPVDDADRAAGATDVLTTDRLGFCNPPELAEKGTIDVLVLAGSLPNCAGTTAEQNFNMPLARMTGLSAYNMAVPRVGPNEYLEVLRQFGLAMRPRLVLMAVSEGNDLRDVHRFNEFVAGRDDDEEPQRAESGWPFDASYALSFLKGGVELAWREIRRRYIAPDFTYSVTVQGARVAMNIANADLSELAYAKRVQAGRVGPELYAASMREFVALAREHGFAESIEFSDPSITSVMRSYSDVQRAWFRANAEAIGYRYVDATAAMREAARTRPLLFFPSNVHLTAEGQLVLAEAVASAVAGLAGPGGGR